MWCVDAAAAWVMRKRHLAITLRVGDRHYTLLSVGTTKWGLYYVRLVKTWCASCSWQLSVRVLERTYERGFF